jgi:pimeloyl-ACP methyl ester carboxylesterase
MRRDFHATTRALCCIALLGMFGCTGTAIRATGEEPMTSAAPWNPSVTLPPAIDAPRQFLTTRAAGGMAYYADTAGSGRPLLLLHSVNAAPSAMEMKPLFEHFRGKRPVFAPELPGFGSSERRDFEYSPQAYANALNEFLDTVVGEPVDVIALSLSAEFAALAAQGPAGNIATLALISPTGFGKRKPPGGRTGDRILGVLRTPVLGDGLFKLLTSKISIRYFLNLAFENSAPAEMVDYAYLTSHQPNAKFAPFRFLSGKLFTRDAYESLYEPLEVPVLMLYDEDPNISFERLPDMLDKHSNWVAVRITPTRGLPHWERLEETASALDRFWQNNAL